MNKKEVFKKIVAIITAILILVIGIGIGIFVNKKITNNQAPEKQEEGTIKASPYTLDELYAIVENPEKFYKVNEAGITDYSIVITHFYDYFSRTTPVKVATKVKVNESNEIVEVIECKYINYDEYMEEIAVVSEYEQIQIKATEEYNEKYNENSSPQFVYKYFVERLIYGNATIVNPEVVKETSKES